MSHHTFYGVKHLLLYAATFKFTRDDCRVSVKAYIGDKVTPYTYFSLEIGKTYVPGYAVSLDDRVHASKTHEMNCYTGNRVLIRYKKSADKGLSSNPVRIFRGVTYRLRLPEELSSVHDTFYVLNLKKCLADANLHVPLDEIKIDKTLRFVKEPIEIMDREVRSLKRSKISLVKVRWNSKCGPEFTWEREDHMKSKYPQLFVDRDVKPAS
ncbi:hypothetical protein Tco_1211335 [Tanacetum coccineum]